MTETPLQVSTAKNPGLPLSPVPSPALWCFLGGTGTENFSSFELQVAETKSQVIAAIEIGSSLLPPGPHSQGGCLTSVQHAGNTGTVTALTQLVVGQRLRARKD